MSLAALGVSAGAIYSFFLAWGLLQERIGTQSYPRKGGPTNQVGDTFTTPLFLNAVQCLFSALVATLYLLFVKTPSKESRLSSHSRLGSVTRILGVHALTHRGAAEARKPIPKEYGQPAASKDPVEAFFPPLLVRYLAISLFQTMASQLAFFSLSWGVSYPTLTLAKSCKLVPVLLMNVLLYRRRFAAYKYAVVGLVTCGICIFMFCGHPKPVKPGKVQASNSVIGILCLLLNLGIDGATNSTQDEVFSRYTISGPQMMLVMNTIASLLQFATLLAPSPSAALSMLPTSVLGALGPSASALASRASTPNELITAMHFLRSHTQITRDVLAYAAAGALGQVAIFETLERFGSLTLVSITVTRKLFSMLLSVFLYNHKLTSLQWLGASIVFVGIGIEAQQKRKEGKAKAEQKKLAANKAQ